jgi:polar amino acid transport system substrate-binding protein
MVRSAWKGAIPAGLVLLLAACTGSSASPSASASQALASPVATIPDDQLLFAGKLVVCIDIPYPPQEFFDEQGNPTGSDVDIAAEIANRLGLEMQVENSYFDTIIAALAGGKCDMVLSAQNITGERLGQVDMIPYFEAGQAFVVGKGNPEGISKPLDLCGKTVAAESGTTEVQYVEGSGDYEGGGLNKACAAAGKPDVDLQQFPKDSDAILALTSGQVVAYFADSPVAGYYTVQHADQLELSGVTVEVALEGISVLKDKAHKGLREAVLTALQSMVEDGKYLEILGNYGLEDGALKADQIEIQHKD